MKKIINEKRVLFFLKSDLELERYLHGKRDEGEGLRKDRGEIHHSQWKKKIMRKIPQNFAMKGLLWREGKEKEEKTEESPRAMDHLTPLSGSSWEWTCSRDGWGLLSTLFQIKNP